MSFARIGEIRMTPEERDTVERVARSLGGEAISEDRDYAREAVMSAADHIFKRTSTIAERRLIAESLKRSAGKASIDTVEDQYRRYGFLTAERGGRRMVTTREVLSEEKAMLEFARAGRGTCRAMGRGRHVFARSWLNDGQRNAVSGNDWRRTASS